MPASQVVGGSALARRSELALQSPAPAASSRQCHSPAGALDPALIGTRAALHASKFA